ncbi:MAG TPA: MerR family transcriptional regulator [Candidimonas sp.]|nr:MerR family transcriptional regulator [Candidimonas sp.]
MVQSQETSIKETSTIDHRFTIGHIARLADVNVETVRYYQRIGLLDEPQKKRDGYRRYSSDTVRDIRFIKRAQGLGFSLKEIAAAFHPATARNCESIAGMTARKLQMLDETIHELTARRCELSALVSRCAECKVRAATSACKIVQALQD